jgi:hypothetical protein
MFRLVQGQQWEYSEYAPVKERARLVLSPFLSGFSEIISTTAKSGQLSFEADFVTEFIVAPNPQGASLRVVQDGFPTGREADDFYAACETGWRETFRGRRLYLEHGDAQRPVL